MTDGKDINPKINFKNYDDDKMIVSNKMLVNNLINLSFNSHIESNRRGSKLGESLIKSESSRNNSILGRIRGANQSKKSVEYVETNQNNNNNNMFNVYPAVSFYGGENSKESEFSTKINQDNKNTNNSFFNRKGSFNSSFSKFKNSPNFTGLKKMNDLSLSGINLGTPNDSYMTSSQIGFANKGRTSSFTEMNLPQNSKYKNVVKNFKRYTVLVDKSEVINLDEKKVDILSHDMDKNASMINDDEKLLDDFNFEEDENCDADLDENVDDRKNVFDYRLLSKDAKILSKDKKINFDLLLRNYYDNCDENKLKEFKEQLEKLRNWKEKVEEFKNRKEYFQAKLEKGKQSLDMSIEVEKKKLERISTFDINKIDNYDRLNIEKHKTSQDLNIDITKYIESDDITDMVISEKKIMLEMHTLKLKYEERSKKYKEIIRKLKDEIKKRVMEISRNPSRNSHNM